MRLFRNPAFLMAVTVTTILAVYMGLVATRAVQFIQTGDAAARWFGVGMLILPAIGLWWVIREWALGTAVQRMSDELEEEGRLPVAEGERNEAGRFTDAAVEAMFEVARREVEMAPNDWAAWFHVAFAYEAGRDRQMARKSLRHAAELYRASQRAQ